MPDLTTEHFRTCKSNLFWQRKVKGSNDNEYTVVFGRTPGGPYEYGWSCDCPSFQFGNKKDKDGCRTCKHIEAVRHEKCEWNWEAFMGHSFEILSWSICK